MRGVNERLTYREATADRSPTRAGFALFGVLGVLAVLGLLLSFTRAFAIPAAPDLSALDPAPAGVDAKQIAKRAEDNMRSERTYFEGQMTVVSPRLSRPRVVAFRSWADDKQKKSLIRIEKPVKDKGTGFLKIHERGSHLAQVWRDWSVTHRVLPNI